MSASVLPASAGPFERAVSSAWSGRFEARRTDLEAIRTLWDPWTCPASELPLLAWAWSVDIWSDRWSETRKRIVVAEARIYHQRKTSVAGYRMALSYVDAELVRAHLPRHGFFAGCALDPARHAAWLAGLPELRIHKIGATLRPGLAGMFAGRRVARSARRIVLESRRAELIRDGVSTALVMTGVGIDADGRLRPVAEQMVIPSAAPSRTLHAGGARLGRFVARADAAAGAVLTLAFGGATDAAGFAVRASWPSLTPLSPTPRWVAETVTLQPDAARGLIAGGRRRAVRANAADDHFFWSLRLADGTTPQLGTMSNRVGRTRTRRVAYTLGLLVHAPAPPRQRHALRSRLAHPDPAPRVAEIMAAADQPRAARDTLAVDINALRPLRYGDLATQAATVRYGAYIRN